MLWWGMSPGIHQGMHRLADHHNESNVTDVQKGKACWHTPMNHDPPQDVPRGAKHIPQRPTTPNRKRRRGHVATPTRRPAKPPEGSASESDASGRLAPRAARSGGRQSHLPGLPGRRLRDRLLPGQSASCSARTASPKHATVEESTAGRKARTGSRAINALNALAVAHTRGERKRCGGVATRSSLAPPAHPRAEAGAQTPSPPSSPSGGSGDGSAAALRPRVEALAPLSPASGNLRDHSERLAPKHLQAIRA